MKVLLVNTGDGSFDGVSQVEFNWWKELSTQSVNYDFLTLASTTFNLYRSELLRSGSKIFDFKSRGNKISRNIQFVRFIRVFFSKNKYDIIHINTGMSLRSLIVLVMAKKLSAKVILHAHSSVQKNNLKQKLFRKLLVELFYRLSDARLAVSKTSALTFFPKKYVNNHQVKIVMNGIDLNKFKFNIDVRRQMREKYHIKSSDLAVGFIGRMIYQKNPDFASEIFHRLLSTQSNIKVFMLGEGPLLKKIRSSFATDLLNKQVFFVGNQKSVTCYYQMLDILIMPSRFEGLPMVAIEAQASGLRTLLSDNITKESIITDTTCMLEARDPNSWVQKILQKKMANSEPKRTAQFEVVRRTRFDITQAGISILNIYKELNEEK
ncbi:glycosyltransferase [Oenococcus oeni]|uniref:glycosyltransferase n=1 Tax=Oenococcus oeni TaxID=1247 RepID=UPI0008F7F68A|nr:glycosyltransferase [Oenococcus oeni]OIM08174.1 hypothetical protein ATX52_07480 [Oenococcus oeni]